MARKCPSCNKFASIDDSAEVEVDDSNLEDDGTVTVSVRIPLMSTCCDEEMASTTLEFEGDMNEAHSCGLTDDEKEEPGVEPAWFTDTLEVEGEFTSRTGGKGRKGFAITYYGADLHITAECANCHEKVTLDGNVDEKASYFEVN